MRRRLLVCALVVSGLTILVLGLPLLLTALVRQDPLERDVVVLLVVAFGAAGFAASAGLGLLQGRAVAAQVATLAERAERLGSGDKRLPVRTTVLPE
ncbi:MAG: hypothetical protein ACRDWY_18705, partial [Actinomycetes bacterium]